ncbi:thioredoxin, mitochondrial [Pristis pectinata]|uniref:thioredoxin, mitochondrial n=1 Tax=Pristis pectinata TaxID=685728 RepID=UPI00223CEE99|nr:thioredoxin, mitochondrial [Pristis pectinata]
MAHRLLLRRLTSVTLREAPRSLQSQSSAHLSPLSSFCWHGTKPPLHHPASLRIARRFCASPASDVSFNIQNQADFTDRVINSTKPVLVDFHASWCGPCRMLGPRLEKMVAKQEGKVIMAKVDIDDHTDLAIEYKVSVVPTVIAIKDGDVVDQFTGVKSEDDLEVFIKKLM